MANWAKIDENGIVERIVVTSNDEFDEGESWILENLGGKWVKTSYNTFMGKHTLGGEPLRKNFAQPGFSYDSELDAFIPPKREEEADFVLDKNTCCWVPPLPFPKDADFIFGYRDTLELKKVEIQGSEGLTETLVPNIPSGSKVYYWDFENSAWVSSIFAMPGQEIES